MFMWPSGPLVLQSFSVRCRHAEVAPCYSGDWDMQVWHLGHGYKRYTLLVVHFVMCIRYPEDCMGRLRVKVSCCGAGQVVRPLRQPQLQLRSVTTFGEADPASRQVMSGFRA